MYLTAAHNDIPYDITQKAYSKIVAHETATHTQAHVLHNTLPFPKTIAYVQWSTYTIDFPISITHTPTTSTVQYKNFHATLGIAQPQELSWVRSQIVNQMHNELERRREARAYTYKLRHDPAFYQYMQNQIEMVNSLLRQAICEASMSKRILARLCMHHLELASYHGDALRQFLLNFNQCTLD